MRSKVGTGKAQRLIIRIKTNYTKPGKAGNKGVTRFLASNFLSCREIAKPGNVFVFERHREKKEGFYEC